MRRRRYVPRWWRRIRSYRRDRRTHPHAEPDIEHESARLLGRLEALTTALERRVPDHEGNGA